MAPTTAPPAAANVSRAAANAGTGPRAGDPDVTLEALVSEHIRLVLESVHGNQSEAARRLGIGRNTLARKISGDPE